MNNLERLRHLSVGGCRIGQHRAFATVPPRELAVAFALALALTLLWLFTQRWICGLWAALLGFGAESLHLPATVGWSHQQIGPLTFDIPYLDLSGGPPSRAMWRAVAVVTFAAFVGSMAVSKARMGLRYFIRTVAAIQTSALLYFAFWGEQFPHDVAGYMETVMTAAFALISMVPGMLGLTYYIFDFSLTQKLALTVASIVHLSLFVPLQYLLQAWVLQRGSLLLMPPLYLMLSLLLDVFVLIAIYAWGMSWHTSNEPRIA